MDHHDPEGSTMNRQTSQDIDEAVSAASPSPLEGLEEWAESVSDKQFPEYATPRFNRALRGEGGGDE